MTTPKIQGYDDMLALFPLQPRKKAGKGYLVLCPAHNDTNPSLWITPPKKDGFIADWTCQAGCSREAVLMAVGLTWTDVRDNQHISGNELGGKLVGQFSYEIERGQEVFQLRRFNLGDGSKTFKAWHKEDGEYVPGMGEYKDKPILYRLPELRQAVSNGKTILLPEGEGKVNRLRELGYEATTNPFGAGKWNEGYTKELVGADVLVLPDYDKPGLDFAEQKAKALHGTAKRVRIVQLTDIEALRKMIGKDGVDIINWLDAGHTKEELQTLIDSAPEWKPSLGAKTEADFRLTRLSDLLREPDEDIDYLWENTLIKGGLSILVAKPKVGKSTLARNLAYALAKGEPSFLGRNITSSGPIVYLALEEKRSEVKKHFERMGATEDLPIFIHTGSAPEQAIEKLRKATIESKALLAIVDPLQRLVRLPDLNDYSSVSLALEPLMQIARDTGCHILLIHHANKGIARDGGDSILGSTAIFGSVDCALIMKRGESYRTIESIQRYGEDLPRTVLTFDVATGLTGSGGNIEDVELAECGKAILELLADQTMTEQEIKEGISDHPGGMVSKGLRLLFQQGKVQRQGLGKKGDPYQYFAAPQNAGNSRNLYIPIPSIPGISLTSSGIGNHAQNAGNSNLMVLTENANKPIPSISRNLEGQTIDRRESVLGMTVEKVIEFWRSEGAPLIHLGDGENCQDLEKSLSNPGISQRHLEAVRTWLDKVLKKRGEAC